MTDTSLDQLIDQAEEKEQPENTDNLQEDKDRTDLDTPKVS